MAVRPGETRTVSFASGPAELANADELGALVLAPGRFGVAAGDVVTPAVRAVVLVGEAVTLKPPPMQGV